MDRKHKASISFTIGQLVLAGAAAFGWVVSVEVRLAVGRSETSAIRETMHEIKEDVAEIKSMLMKGARK
jgi:hypothetical protein